MYYLIGRIGFIRNIPAFLISFCLCVCVTGCLFSRPRPVEQGRLEKIDPSAMIEAEKRRETPGPPPFSEKLEPMTEGVAEDTILYSFVFDNAPLGDVFNAIASDTDLNLSVASDIDLSRPVTVRLKNVTFKEALDMIVVKGAGYAWKIGDGCLHIKRFEERIYHLDYLNLKGETDVEVGGDMLASGVEESGVTGKYEVRTERKKENSSKEINTQTRSAFLNIHRNPLL